MSISVYDRSGQEQGTYDKNTRSLALYDGNFTGELYEYNNTRIGVVEYGGRFKLDSTTISASSSSGGSDFGSAFATLGTFAIIGIFFVGPLLLGGALTGAILSKNKRETIKWALISLGVLSVFWFSFAYSASRDSMFAMIGFSTFFIVAFMGMGSTFAFQKYIDSKLGHLNRFLKWLARSLLGTVWMIVVLVIAELALGFLPLYLTHPAWMNPFQSEKSALAIVESLQKSQTKVYGPTKGVILHTPGDNAFSFASSDIVLKNFIVEVQFRNPNKPDIQWRHGINFRQTYDVYSAYFLYFSSTSWEMEVVKNGNWSSGGYGDLKNINLAPNGLNTFYLVVNQQEALLFVNDEFVTKLDVSNNRREGNILLFTADEYKGEKTIFEKFTIWKLDD